MSVRVRQLVHVVVDADGLRAWVKPDEHADLSELDSAQMKAGLEEAKIVVGDDVAARIEAYLKQLRENGPPDEIFLIADGRAPVEGKDGKFEWAKPELEQPAADEDARIDYRALNSVRTVEEGTTIGKIIPPVEGVCGVDVHGNSLKPKKHVEPVKLLSNVRLGDDGVSVVATAPGRVVFERGRLSVHDVVQISGDVDFDSGHVDVTSDVRIHGTVRDLFKVRSAKSITVDGAIEAAEVTAGESLLVHGGILGRQKGKVEAEKELAAKFCDEADIVAKGDVYITKETINSRVYTDGKFISERGSIIGGESYAKAGIEVNTAGSEAGIPTQLRIGVHQAVLWQVQQIETETKASQEAAAKIREMVQPLLDNLRRLTPQQREKATELMFNADEMEAAITQKQQAQQRLIEEGTPQAPAAMVVNGSVHRGVTLAIGDRVTRFPKEFKGPVRVELQKIDNVTEFVAVNQLTGSVTRLPSTRVELTPPEEPAETENAE